MDILVNNPLYYENPEKAIPPLKRGGI